MIRSIRRCRVKATKDKIKPIDPTSKREEKVTKESPEKVTKERYDYVTSESVPKERKDSVPPFKSLLPTREVKTTIVGKELP